MRIIADNIGWSAGSTQILQRVSVAAPSGSMLGVIGPNGSGKSTLLRALAGMIPATGKVFLGDTDADTLSRLERARHLAFLEQTPSTDLELRVEEVVRLGRFPHRSRLSPDPDGEQIVQAALERVTMGAYRNRRWSSLSGGEKQRVLLARAFAQQTGIIVLDEPTNHLDVRNQFDLLHRLSEGSETIVISLHDLTLASRYCDVLALLYRGRIVATGPPRDVLTPGRVEEVFGINAAWYQTPDGERLQLSYDPESSRTRENLGAVRASHQVLRPSRNPSRVKPLL